MWTVLVDRDDPIIKQRLKDVLSDGGLRSGNTAASARHAPLTRRRARGGLALPAVEGMDKNPDWTAAPFRWRFPTSRVIPVSRGFPPRGGCPTSGRVSVVPPRPLRVIPVRRCPASRVIPVRRGRPPRRRCPTTDGVSVVPPRPLRVVPVRWYAGRVRIRGSYGRTCERAGNRYTGCG
jgi:hypothetical protein